MVNFICNLYIFKIKILENYPANIICVEMDNKPWAPLNDKTPIDYDDESNDDIIFIINHYSND